MAEEGEGELPLPSDFGLPREVLAVLPGDPFEQLDVARKITSIALASRVGRLEADAAHLRAQLADRDALLADLRARLDALDASLAAASDQLRRAEDEKETLLKENASLSNTIKKLNRDVSKLEVFKKTLMQSLQEEEGNAHVAPRARVTEAANFSSMPHAGDEDAGLPTSKSSVSPIQFSETGSSVSEESSHAEPDIPKPGRAYGFVASYSSTPRLTPPDSPRRSSASVSPTRRHSISVATRNMFDDRSPIFSSLPSSHHNSSMTSPFEPANQTGRTRVDGKEFFRLVRSRLSYEQFSAFLANVKELNAHKQTREDTLRKADEIFGQDNKDLYTIFEGLITRNVR